MRPRCPISDERDVKKTRVVVAGLLAISATLAACGSPPERNSPTRPTNVTQPTATAELKAAANASESDEALPVFSYRPAANDLHGLVAFPPRNEPNAFFKGTSPCPHGNTLNGSKP